MKEFVDFLGDQAPYDRLDPGDLARLAETVEAEYFRRGALIGTAGDPPLHHLWVVRTGSVDVLDRGRLVDHHPVGDTIGQNSVFAGQPLAYTLRAADDCLLYRIDDPRTLLERPEELWPAARRSPDAAPPPAVEPAANGAPAASTALAEAAADTRAGTARGAARSSLTLRDRAQGALRDRAVVPVSRYTRPTVLCQAADPVSDVARRIGEVRQSCAVVTFPDGTFGVVTDADFRSRVATGLVAPGEEVGRIASRPALSVPDDAALATAFLEMIERDVHHLVVTDSGGRPVGVVRVFDLASAEVRDPIVVRAAVTSAGTLDELGQAVDLLPDTAVELFDGGVPPTRIGSLLTAVLDAVLRRALFLSPMDVDVECSWLVLGSLARREVLPSSDIDTALVWADPAPPEGAGPDWEPPDLSVTVRAAASRVLDAVESTGLRRCADGANADTPRFARSLAQWNEATDAWLRDAGLDSALLLSTMLADSRALTTGGLGQSVVEEMMATPRTPQFLKALLDYTLSSRPPTGFVRDFVVEHSGEHRGKLNLKRGGLRPVTSLGRWAAVITGDSSGTTPERLRRGAEAGILSDDEAESLVGAHEQVYGLLMEMEVESIRTRTPVSTYIAPGRLDSLTRRHLRESFRAIAGVQNRLESHGPGRIPGMS